MQKQLTIQVTKREAEAQVQDTKALRRLMDNPDFQRVIMELYGREEAVRLVHAKADPAMVEPEQQAALNRDMDSIGSLFGFFRGIEQKGIMAEKALMDDAAREAE